MFNSFFSQIPIFNINKPKLLLHICCGPDLIVPLLDLKNYFKLYLYWYNPNIQPYSEYKKRYNEYIKILNLEKWDYEIITDDWLLEKNDKIDKNLFNKYDDKEFYKKLFDYRNICNIKDHNFNNIIANFSRMEEKNSERCDICYYMRLFEAATIAKRFWINFFTTTLLISPKKSVDKLNKFWKIVSEKLWVQYLSFNFRKNNWFKRASEYTTNNNIYRQNYCGCLWSKNK